MFGFYNDLTPATIRALKAVQRVRPYSAVIAAAQGTTKGTGVASVALQGGQHFYATRFMASYTSLALVEAVATDVGACGIAVNMTVGAPSLSLTEGFVPLEAIATPGRQRTPAVSGDPAQQMNFPGFPLSFFVSDGNDITMDYEQEYDVINKTRGAWVGWDIPSSYVPDANAFWQIVMDNQPVAPFAR